MTNTSFDQIDLRILSELKKNARISNLELAECVGLSPTPCGRRVRNLEEKGIIKGYTVQIDHAALGRGISVVVSVKLDRSKSDSIKLFTNSVRGLPNVTELLLVTGAYDYVIRARLKDVETLRDFVVNEISSLPSVSETETLVVLEEIKTETL